MQRVVNKLRQGDLKGSIALLITFIGEQDNLINKQSKAIKALSERLQKVERKLYRTEKLVVEPVLEELTEERSLVDMLKQCYQNNVQNE